MTPDLKELRATNSQWRLVEDERVNQRLFEDSNPTGRLGSFDVWTRETGQWALSDPNAPTLPGRNTINRFLLHLGIRVFESRVQTTPEPRRAGALDLAAEFIRL